MARRHGLRLAALVGTRVQPHPKVTTLTKIMHGYVIDSASVCMGGPIDPIADRAP